MRVVVAGSRYARDPRVVEQELARISKEMGPITCLVEGGASGVDNYARDWCLRVSHVPVVTHWPIWGVGKKAGVLRNWRMMQPSGRPDLVVAFPGGPGTKSCVEQAERQGIQVIRIDKR